MNTAKTAVVALGGNAITRPDEPDTIANQFRHTRDSLAAIIPLLKQGYNLAITHGNGPQVGNALLRVELSRGKAPILPLGICVADTEGGMGYMIGQSLQNRLHADQIDRQVLTIVTQVIVDRNDPSVKNPSKYVGQFYAEDEARRFEQERGWSVKRHSARGWRRVVPSPMPLSIVEADAIASLVQQGYIVIAAGGGGIPVYVEEDGSYEGLDAVIDKDRASAVLAKQIGASLFVILTDVTHVAIHYDTPKQQDLKRISLAEAERFYQDGHFPPGSMGPKIEAALTFLRGGGDEVLITSINRAAEALHGECGTRITRE